MADDLFDYEEPRSAAEAAAVLRELADGLEGGSIEFAGGDETVVVEVPDEVTLELELERETDEDGSGEIEVEVEFAWETPGWTEVRPAEEGAETDGIEGESAEMEGVGDEPGGVEDELEGVEDEPGGVEEAVSEEGVADPEEAESRAVEGEEATEPEQLPVPAAPSVVRASRGTSLARFQLFRDRAGEWRWRLVHRNGNIIATSGEGYTRRHNAEKGLRSVVANAPDAEVELEEE